MRIAMTPRLVKRCNVMRDTRNTPHVSFAVSNWLALIAKTGYQARKIQYVTHKGGFRGDWAS